VEDPIDSDYYYEGDDYFEYDEMKAMKEKDKVNNIVNKIQHLFF